MGLFASMLVICGEAAATPAPSAPNQDCASAKAVAATAQLTYETATRYERQGRLDDAMKQFASAMRQFVDAQNKCDVAAYVWMQARCQEGLFEYEEAVRLIDRSLSSDRKRPLAPDLKRRAIEEKHVIENVLPRLRLTVRGATPVDVNVKIDGRPTVISDSGVRIVAEGSHVVLIGYLNKNLTFNRDFKLKSDESVVADFRVLPAVSPAPSPVALNPVVSPPDPVVTPPPNPIVTPPVDYSRYAPVVVGAIFTTGGLATLVTGAVVDDNPRKTKKEALFAIGTVTTLVGIAALSVSLHKVITDPPTSRASTLPLRIVGRVGIGSIYVSGDF